MNTANSTYGMIQQSAGRGKHLQLVTKSETYVFKNELRLDQFVRDQGIVILDSEEFAQVEEPEPSYNQNSLTGHPVGFENEGLRMAKMLASKSVFLWKHADRSSRDWWRQYTQQNDHRLGHLLSLITGLSAFQVQYERYGGIAPVDWLGELRKCSHSRFSSPEDLLDQLENAFFDE